LATDFTSISTTNKNGIDNERAAQIRSTGTSNLREMQMAQCHYRLSIDVIAKQIGLCTPRYCVSLTKHLPRPRISAFTKKNGR
jgi:hypothetical protein